MKGILSLLLLTSFVYIALSAKADEGSIVVSMKSVNITVPYNPARKYFTIPIAVGTPKQIYNVQIDTSVATSWLPSALCKNCQKATKFYNHKESTELQFHYLDLLRLHKKNMFKKWKRTDKKLSSL